jgi:hypothetical protein
VADTSTWKTYRNEKYGMEFKYPPDWTIKDFEKEIALSPSLKDQPNINISISVVASGMEHFSLNCPITIHEIECKNLKNPGGINYTRNISTGQLQLSNQQQLDGFLQSPNADLQITTILTDEKGNPDPLSPQTVKVFDQILSTFKFIKPVDTSTWKTYTNKKYGYEVKYPPEWKTPRGNVMVSSGKIPGTGIEFKASSTALNAIVLGMFDQEKGESLPQAFRRINDINPSQLTSSKISVAGIDAIEYPDVPGYASYSEVLVANSGTIYRFDQYTDDKTFASFLSTFKFIQ